MKNIFEMFKVKPNTQHGKDLFQAEYLQYGKERTLEFYKNEIEKYPELKESMVELKQYGNKTKIHG